MIAAASRLPENGTIRSCAMKMTVGTRWVARSTTRNGCCHPRSRSCRRVVGPSSAAAPAGTTPSRNRGHDDEKHAVIAHRYRRHVAEGGSHAQRADAEHEDARSTVARNSPRRGEYRQPRRSCSHGQGSRTSCSSSRRPGWGGSRARGSAAPSRNRGHSGIFCRAWPKIT